MAYKTVNIPGLGPVNFPDTMSEDDINTAAKNLYEQNQANSPPEKPTAFGKKLLNTGPTSDENYQNAQRIADQQGVPNPYDTSLGPQHQAQAAELRAKAAAEGTLPGDAQTPGYNPANTPVPSLEGPSNNQPQGVIKPKRIGLGPLDNAAHDFQKRILGAVSEDADKFGGVAANALNGVGAGLDMANTMAANALMSIYSGWKGAMNLTFTGNPDRAAAQVRDTGTVRPFSQGGKEMAQGLGQGMARVDDFVKDISWEFGMHNPELATAAYTAIQMVPIERGFLAARPGVIAVKTVYDRTRSMWENKGITLGSRKMDDQMKAFVQGPEYGDIPRQRGTALEPLISDVRNKETNLKNEIANTQTIVDQANTNPKVRVKLKGFDQAMAEVDNRWQSDYDTTVLDNVNVKRGRELVQEVLDDKRKTLSLIELDSLRTKLKNLPGASNGPLAVLHDGVDNFINNQIAQGFITGDKNLAGNVAYLKKLRDQYAAQFNPGTEVYRLATDLNANPEDFSKYIFGLSDSGFKTEAAQTAQKVAEIFGHNSPQMDALRLEMLGTVLEPLRGDTPKWGKFIDIYDKSVRNNKSLLYILSPYQEKNIEQLYRLAKAHESVSPPTRFNWEAARNRVIAEAAGNGLARNSAKLATIRAAYKFLFGQTEGKARNELIEQLTGVKRDAPLFQPGSAPLQMLWASALKQEAQDH